MQAEDYSLSEYNVQQQAQEEQKKMDVRYGLKAARENLSNNNLRQAMSSFSRSKLKGQQFKEGLDESRDLKAVERDLRNAQSSNLIAAQNGYYLENAGKLGDLQMLQLQSRQLTANQVPAQAGGAFASQFLNADADVAAQQWDKLERAQQVAVTKVTPLRVNLPTRGVHLSFAQVLQTELRKPMTVQMLAENTKVPSWSARLFLGVLGFVVLWGFMAMMNRQRA
jgi:hypothetical protein